MKSYKLNIKVLIAAVGIFSLIIFSLVLIIFHIAKTEKVTDLLLEYGYIIAPTGILWVLADSYLWHTKLFQAMRKTLNIPPDIRGRWEEVKQTLTSMHVHSYSSIGHSESILSEFASSHNEDSFTMCYLWQGQINTSTKDIHQSEQFYGYTMLHLHEHESPKILKGPYFTNRISSQTRGGIELAWVSQKLKRKLE